MCEAGLPMFAFLWFINKACECETFQEGLQVKDQVTGAQQLISSLFSFHTDLEPLYPQLSSLAL